MSYNEPTGETLTIYMPGNRSTIFEVGTSGLRLVVGYKTSWYYPTWVSEHSLYTLLRVKKTLFMFQTKTRNMHDNPTTSKFFKQNLMWWIGTNLYCSYFSLYWYVTVVHKFIHACHLKYLLDKWVCYYTYITTCTSTQSCS